MSLQAKARSSRIAVSRRGLLHAVFGYALVPAVLACFAYVALAGFAALSPQPVRLPATTVYDPYLDDFTVFYTAGHLVRTGAAADVYDTGQLHLAEADQLGARPNAVLTLPFFNPPFTLGFFAALSVLGLHPAALIWTLAGMACFLVAAASALQSRPSAPDTAILLLSLGVVSSPPFFQTLLHGQTTFFLVAGYVLLWIGLRGSGRSDLLAACAIVVIAHKPQMVALPVVYLLTMREWRPVVLASASLVGLTAATAAAAGWSLVTDHARLLLAATQWHESNGISTWGMFGWNAFSEALGGSHMRIVMETALLDVATLGLVVAGLKRTVRGQHERLLAILVFGTLLISPHVYEHDVLLAALPVALMTTSQPPLARLQWAAFGILGWAVLYFHFDLLNATSINCTALWLAGGLLISVFPPYVELESRAPRVAEELRALIGGASA